MRQDFAHLCLDMQRMFFEATDWQLPAIDAAVKFKIATCTTDDILSLKAGA